MANWWEEHDAQMKEIKGNSSPPKDNRPMRHGKEYGGSYRPDLENPPRSKNDRRDTQN